MCVCLSAVSGCSLPRAVSGTRERQKENLRNSTQHHSLSLEVLRQAAFLQILPVFICCVTARVLCSRRKDLGEMTLLHLGQNWKSV